MTSLIDYANSREYVVLFFTSTATPAGDYSPLGHADLDFADRNGLLDLEGTVDSEGAWRWHGEGDPTDDQRNSILKLQAYPDQARWQRIVREYEAGE